MSNTQLTMEQGDLAFHILGVMADHFPDNPEHTIAALEVVLNATKEACIEDGTYTDE